MNAKTKIDASAYTGLAKARIVRYNNAVEDFDNEVRLGRGDDNCANTIAKDILIQHKAAIKEMIAQDSRNGRITSQNNLGT